MSCEGLLDSELQVCQAARAAADAAAAAARLAEGQSTAETVIALMQGIASLLLPLAAILLIVGLWPVLKGIFETRKFTIKVGGFELSAQEATEQLRQQIEDLQSKVADLEARRTPPVPDTMIVPTPMEGDPFALPEDDSAPVGDGEPRASAPPMPQPTPRSSERPAPARVLWVDDNPSNNATIAAALQDDGVAIDFARSTLEAMTRLSKGEERYAAIITDQGRMEEKQYNATAGNDLIRLLRDNGTDLPIAVFTGNWGLAKAPESRDLGAALVTSSGVELRRFVARHVGGYR